MTVILSVIPKKEKSINSHKLSVLGLPSIILKVGLELLRKSLNLKFISDRPHRPML